MNGTLFKKLSLIFFASSLLTACGMYGELSSTKQLPGTGSDSTTSGIVVVPPISKIRPTELSNVSLTGGTPPYTFEVVSGAGSIQDNQGQFKVTSAQSGLSTIKITDANGLVGYALIFASETMSLSPSTKTMVVGQTFPFRASGGTPPYNYFIVNGPGTISASSGDLTTSGSGTVNVGVMDADGAVASAVVTVVNPLAVPAGINTIHVGGTFSPAITGGVSPYVYSILSGDGSISGGGTYTAPNIPTVAKVKITDQLGQEVSTVIEVVENLAITPSAASVAKNGTFAFSAIGGKPPYTYSLIAGSQGAVNASSGVYTAPNSVGGPYGIKVTDALGASSTASLTVTSSNTFSIASLQVQTSGTLDVGNYLTGGTPSFSYNVAAGEGSFAGSIYTAPATSGTYQITVYDSATPVPLSVGTKIYVFEPLTLSLSTNSVSVSKSVFLSPAGGIPPYSYSSSGGGSFSQNTFTAPSSAGSVTLTVTDSAGSTATKTLTVVAPLAVTPTVASVAKTNTLALVASGGVSPYIYSVKSGTGVIDSSGVFTAPNTTEFDIINIKDQTGNSVDVQISVISDLSVAPTVATISKGSTLTIAASGGISPYTYQVTSGGGSFSGNVYTAPASAGSVVLTVSDSIGTSKTINVAVYDSLQISPLSSNTEINQSVTFSAVGGKSPYVYAVTSGVGSININTGAYVSAVAGTANIQVTDADGATSATSVNVVGPLTLAAAPLNIAVGTNRVYSASGGVLPYVYTITSGGGSFTGSTFSAPATAGASVLKVTDARGNYVTTSVYAYEALQISPTSTSVLQNQSTTLSGQKGVAPYVFSIQSGPGTINASTGEFSSGTVGLATVLLTDANGNTATALVNVVAPLSVSPTSANLTQNQTLTVTPSGGVSPYIYSVVSGTGTFIGGVYTAPSSDTNAVVRVTDQLNRYVDIPINVRNPLTIESQLYAYNGAPLTLTPAGGAIPYSFVVVSGAGTINATTGQFFSTTNGSVVVRVTDSLGATADTTITVGPALQISPTTQSITVGGNITFSASGGVPPYTFSVASGTGTINSTSGYFTASSTVGSSTIRVTDAFGNYVSATAVVTAEAPTQFAFISAAQTFLADQCSGQITLQSQDSGGNASPVNVDTNVALSVSSGLIYTDATCAGAPVTSVKFSQNTSSTYFYVKTQTAGALSVMASATGLGVQFQTETVNAGIVTTVVSTPTSTSGVAGQCIDLNLKFVDNYGNMGTRGSDTTLTLTGSSVTFYNGTGCSSGTATTVTITSGQSQKNISFKRNLVGSTRIGIDPAIGLINGDFQYTVSPAAPSKVVLTSTLAGMENSNVIWSVQPQFEIRDAFDNLASSATNSVQLKIYTDAACSTLSSGTLSATTNPVTAVSGVAAFAGVKHSSSWGNIYVAGESSGLTSACSPAVLLVPDFSTSLVSSPANVPNDGVASANIFVTPRIAGVNIGSGFQLEINSTSSNVTFVGGGSCSTPSATCARLSDLGTGVYSGTVTNLTQESVTFQVKIVTTPQLNIGSSFTVNFNSTLFTIVNSTVTWNSAPTPNNVYIQTGATLTINTGTTQMNLGDVFMSGGTLKHTASTTGTLYNINLNVNSFNMTGGSVNVNGLGYPAGYTWGANGAISTALGTGVGSYNGGSHGGGGGAMSGAVYKRASDYVRNPTLPGGGGGSAAGGGVVRVRSSSFCLFNNGISVVANGASSLGSGAGGTINFNCAGFAGTAASGAFTANGGNATGIDGYGRGGGGGGMIAFISSGNTASFTGSFVYPTNLTLLGNFKLLAKAIGGTSYNSTYTAGYGSAGTVYLEHADNSALGGDLIVDNGSIAAAGNSYNGRTYLPSIQGTITAISGNQITLTTTSTPALSASYDGYYNNRYVKPKIAYDAGTPSNPEDDNLMLVTSSNGTTMQLSGGNMGLVSVGDTLRSIEIFDHIYVGPGVVLESNGDIYVRNGSLYSPSTTNLTVQGLIAAAVLTPAQGTTSIDAGYMILPDPYTLPTNLTVTGGTVTGGALSGTNLTVTGGTLTGTDLTLADRLVSSGGTLTVNNLTVNTGVDIAGGTVSTQTLNTPGALTITSGTLKHAASTTSVLNRLIANVGSLTMTSGSINLNSLGYPAGYAWGANDSISTSPFGVGAGSNSGGSHGGVGGGLMGFIGKKSFDYFRDPMLPGGGGGVSAGGGVIRLTSSGPCVMNNDATITANGGGSGSAGAGGTIYLKCPSFNGTAAANAITANGGSGSYVTFSNGRGGGGGGMIALISTGTASSFMGSFAYPSDASSLSAFKNIVKSIGGNGYSWSGSSVGGAGSAGMIYLQHSGNAALGGDLIIDNGSTASYSTPYNGRTFLPSIEATITAVVGNQVNVTTTSTPALGASYDNFYAGKTIRPNIAFNNGTANDWTDDNLMTVSTNASTTLTLSGGDIGLVAVGQTLRSIEVLDHINVGAGVVLESNGDIYVRNGALHSPSTTNLITQGLIAANYFPTSLSATLDVGYLLVPDNFTLPSNSVLNGATLAGINLSGDSFTVNSGTVSMTTMNFTGRVDVNGGTVTTNDVTATAGIGITGTGTLTTQNLTTSGALSISSGTLKHAASTTSVMNRLIANVGSLYMSGGSINLSGLGFPSGYAWGAGDVVSSSLGCGGYGGGCHIGVGGGSGGNQAKRTYDDVKNPQFPGGGGASTGGGAVRITSAGSCVIHSGATILANGNSVNTGAGGTVYLNCASIGGTASAGAIQATGGNASYGGDGYGRGGSGGGAVALISRGDKTTFTGSFAYPTDLTTLNNIKNVIKANGGTGYSNVTPAGAGGAGSIYFESSENAGWGDLIIDNAGTSTYNHTYNGRTVLPSASGTITAIIGNQITLNSSSTPTFSASYNNYFVNRKVRPDSTYTNGTATDPSDDNLMTVSANSNSTINVTGGNLGLVSVGNNLRTIDMFDHIYLGAGVVLESNGDLYVRNGSLLAPSTTQIDSLGLFSVAGLFPGVGIATLSSGAYILPDGFVIPANTTISGASVTGVNSTGTNITISSGSATFTSLNLTGDINLSGGSLTSPTLVASGNMTMTGGTYSATTSSSFGGLLSISSGTFTSPVVSATSGITITGGTYSATTSTTTQGNLAVTTGSFTSPLVNVTGNLTVNSGTYNTATSSTVGGSVTIAGGTVTIPTLSAGTTMNVSGVGTATLANVTVNGAYTQSGGTIVHPTTTTAASGVYKLNMNVGSFKMDGGSISLAGLGYTKGYSWGPTANTATTQIVGTTTTVGGSHGGRGGGASAQSSGLTFDDYANPQYPGGGGGNATTGFSGGGYFKVTSAGSCQINNTATINVNGAGGAGGAGAGGTIYMICNGIGGSATPGALSAIGGTSTGGSGGGGGRIALISTGDQTSFTGNFNYPVDSTTMSTFLARVRAYGGSASSTATYGHGSAGTIYLKHSNSTNGGLIIDNNALAASTYAYKTEFVAATDNSNTVFSRFVPNTLQITSASTPFATPNRVGLYNGMYLHVFPAAGSADPLDASHIEGTISSMTNNTFVTNADYSGITIASDYKYRLVHKLDSLYLTGNANVDMVGADLILTASAATPCDYVSGNGALTIPAGSSLTGNSVTSVNCTNAGLTGTNTFANKFMP